VAFSVDLLGEACLSQEEARAYQRRYLDLVETLSAAVAAWPADPRLESDHLGPLPRANISIKLSALCARADAIDFDGSLDALAEALQPILAAAAQRQVTVNFDMEQHALKDLTLALFERCCETHDFPAGLALQAYLLVRDPRVAMIAFTGSKEVGLHILRTAGDTPEGQGFVKKVVCEMGGKNAIIVDDSADPGTDLGPVIDAGAAAKIQTYIEIGREEGRLELAGEVPAGLADRVGKPYVGPHIFSEIRPHHRLANEEIFGPVLSLMRVGSFAEALAVANATAYKLTGGVFSRRPSHLEAARREFRVGNLYLNRGITGALVGRQPFGGFGLSGIGSKAGGADYLLHFVEPRSATENTMRHGFAPGLE
jgi:acyl-CoA reductase-like NAD-dependent aldehyde dehydrogenase